MPPFRLALLFEELDDLGGSDSGHDKWCVAEVLRIILQERGNLFGKGKRWIGSDWDVEAEKVTDDGVRLLRRAPVSRRQCFQRENTRLTAEKGDLRGGRLIKHPLVVPIG